MKTLLVLLLFTAYVNDPAPRTVTPTEGVTVTFSGSGEAIVQVDGKTIKLNTTTQEAVSLPQPSQPAQAGETASQQDSKTDALEEEDPELNYGYEMVNLPTPRRFEKNAFAIHFTHRFTQPFFTKDSPPDLFGLDSFSYSGFGLSYGITDRVYAKVYRTPLDRNIEITGGVHLLHQNKRVPVSASAYVSVEGRDNFNRHYTTNIAAQFARSIGSYGSLHFSPIISLNSNPKAQLDPGEDNHTYAFGLGGQLNFRPTASIIFEYIPRAGHKAQPDATISFGIQKRTYRHIFTLTFSNTQATTSSQISSGFGTFGDLRKGLTVGFNIYRRFF